MKNDEKAMMVGVGAILTYFVLREKEEKKEKKINMPNLSISPPIFYA